MISLYNRATLLLCVYCAVILTSVPVWSAAPTAAEECSEIDFDEEQYGPFGDFAMSVQRGRCSGVGHTEYAISLVAREVGSKKIVAAYNDSTMGDGIDPHGFLEYKNGAFIFGPPSHAVVARFDPQAKVFEKTFEEVWTLRGHGNNTDKPTPEISFQNLIGADYKTTLKKMNSARVRDCEYADRGDFLLASPSTYEAAQLIAVHREASKLYKSGRQEKAARLVLQYLGDPGSMDFNFMNGLGGRSDNELELLADLPPETSRIKAKLGYFVETEFDFYSGKEITSYHRIQEWNDLAFFLLKSGYSIPARTILEWVLLGAPDKLAMEAFRKASAQK